MKTGTSLSGSSESWRLDGAQWQGEGKGGCRVEDVCLLPFLVVVVVEVMVLGIELRDASSLNHNPGPF